MFSHGRESLIWVSKLVTYEKKMSKIMGIEKKERMEKTKNRKESKWEKRVIRDKNKIFSYNI